MLDDALLELEAGMVRTEVDAHDEGVSPTCTCSVSTAAVAAGSRPSSRTTITSPGSGPPTSASCCAGLPTSSRSTSRSGCPTRACGACDLQARARPGPPWRHRVSRSRASRARLHDVRRSAGCPRRSRRPFDVGAGVRDRRRGAAGRPPRSVLHDEARVVEAHPELAFTLMGDGTPLPGKRTVEGAALRHSLAGDVAARRRVGRRDGTAAGRGRTTCSTRWPAHGWHDGGGRDGVRLWRRRRDRARAADADRGLGRRVVRAAPYSRSVTRLGRRNAAMLSAPVVASRSRTSTPLACRHLALQLVEIEPRFDLAGAMTTTSRPVMTQ